MAVGGEDNEKALKIIDNSDRFYLYYLKSAENMVMYPYIYENCQKSALDKGFKKKSEIVADDVIVVSYFEKDKI